VVVVLGGGVAGDLGGFVAATYLRGVTLWQVPTTVLAQVDSSVGGKVAINLPAGKNLVGSFHQAERVVIDPEVLVTLPEGEYVGGLGEVVKYALLDGPMLLERLETGLEGLRRREPALLSDVIRRCVEMKAAVVEGDERDQGRRAILNLGHTAAHALEAVLGYGALPHGAAVGLGLLVALRVSEDVVGTDRTVRERTRRLLGGLGLPTAVDLPDVDRLLEAAVLDKKQTSAGRGFVCLRTPGDPVWGMDVPDEILRESFTVIRA
jgi:3-dehydroquinate synthase